MHNRHFIWRHIVIAAALAIVAGIAPQIAGAADISAADAEWTVDGKFKNKKARINLSGAACAPTATPFRSCIVVNDDNNSAQFFRIDGATIEPGAVMLLTDAEGDPDAEGAAYDSGYFYVTGSHGRGRNSDKKNQSSYVVFRFEVDPSTGQPAFDVSDEEVAGVERSSRLREALQSDPRIAGFIDEPLADGGVNIEGIAVMNGRMYFGLRGPSTGGSAFVLSVDAQALFTRNHPLKARVHPLALGDVTGIRDLAVTRDGLLVLSGPVNEQPVRPTVFRWKPDTDVLDRLGELPLPPALQSLKAETLLVLRDDGDEPLRVLVMFDGAENGAPTEFLIRR